jgi:hypothetical protein
MQTGAAKKAEMCIRVFDNVDNVFVLKEIKD